MTWRPLTLAERQLTFIWSGLILATIALRPLWIVLAPYLRPCGLREVTGIPCPTCGTTRSGLALLEGRLADALLYNPLFTIAAVAFVIGGLVAPLWAWRRGIAPSFPSPLPRWSRLVVVVAIVANWAWVIVHA